MQPVWGGTRLSRALGSAEGTVAMHRDLDRLEEGRGVKILSEIQPGQGQGPAPAPRQLQESRWVG